MTARFVPFDPATAPADEWARLHAYRRARHAELRPGDPLMDDATFEQAARNEADNPEFTSLRFAILDAATGAQIGSMSYGCLNPASPSYAENHALGRVQLVVLGPWRHQGIGRAGLARLRDLMRAHGQSVVIGATAEADGEAFARAVGAEVALAGSENRLDLADVDWAMVDRWIAEGQARAPDACLTFFDHLPDAIADPFAELYTETFNQQPLGELAVGAVVFTPEILRRNEANLERLGGRHISAVIQETDGALSGLTELVWIPGRPTLAEQGLTGVRDAFRGGGRGKWLKAAMLRRARAELPDVVTIATDNASSNAPMLAINAQLGFRPHMASVNVQLTIEALEGYLSREGDGEAGRGA